MPQLSFVETGGKVGLDPSVNISQAYTGDTNNEQQWNAAQQLFGSGQTYAQNDPVLSQFGIPVALDSSLKDNASYAPYLTDYSGQILSGDPNAGGVNFTADTPYIGLSPGVISSPFNGSASSTSVSGGVGGSASDGDVLTTNANFNASTYIPGIGYVANTLNPDGSYSGNPLSGGVSYSAPGENAWLSAAEGIGEGAAFLAGGAALGAAGAGADEAAEAGEGAELAGGATGGGVSGAVGGADIAEGGAGLSEAGFLGGAGGGAELAGTGAGAAGGAEIADTAPLFGGGASGGTIAGESGGFGGGATSDASAAGAAGGGATLSDGSSAIETPGAGSGLDGGSGTPTPTANSLSLGDSTNSLFSPSAPSSLDTGAANGANMFGGIGGGGGEVPGGDAGGATLSDGSAAIDTPADSPWWQKALKATGIYNPNNPLGIGKNAVSGLGMIYNGIQQKNAKNSLQKQIQDASGPLAAESKSLIAQGNSGAVPPAISQQYATQRDNAIAAIKQRYANMGRDPNNDSQAAAEILAANNAYGTALATYSNQLLTEGMQAASIVQDAGIEAAKAGASEDVEFQKSLMNFLASTGLNAAGIK